MREFTEEERTHYAESGHALPDGSYPMPDCDAVEDAIEAYGRAPDSHRKDLAALIERRNDELECGHDLTKIREEAHDAERADEQDHEHGDEHEHE